MRATCCGFCVLSHAGPRGPVSHSPLTLAAAAHAPLHLPALPPQIFVRSLSGSTVTVNDLASTDAVAACCAKLAAKEGFECEDLRLVFEGKQLEMDRQLGEYSVAHGAHRHYK